jgi:probable F420-dependent oxidoreductase
VPPRPFRFSLQAVSAGSGREWLDLARKAEALGFDALVTADHLDAMYSPITPLAAVAPVTTTLRLGVLVLNNDFRHPALVAREIATLDALSDGRAEVGLGAGHAFPEYERNGIPFDAPGVRVSRLAESVQLIRRLLDGESVVHAGDHYRLDGEVCHPLPVQARVPILIGGGGNRVLSIAARHADIVGFAGTGRTRADGNRHEPTGFPAAAVDAQVNVVRAAAGPRLADIELHALVQVVTVTDDPLGVAEALAAEHLPDLAADDVLATPYLLIGSVKGLIDELQAHRERWGFSHFTVRPPAMDAFAPVVAALAGR